ncbi:MAG: hypothetical protein MK198_04700 [Gracilimonas sp.]|uniref:hypothetical protein n=1 Tax=Gracilimonas sp. TaxID=1974203 RepID=UPI0037514373|nr:hypothetical protein [Gracilimonas sp.]
MIRTHLPKTSFKILLTLVILVLSLAAVNKLYAQGGHGPVFTLATPTLGQGELSFDVMAMSTRQGNSAWMLRQNWHYGLTEDIQLNVSVPTPLQRIDNPPQERLGTMMGSYGDLEVSGLFRFFKTYPGVGQRFEATVLLSGSIPTEDKRGGLDVGPSLHGGLVTGYASRTLYAWAGGGYQYYIEQHNDRLGDIAYITGVIGYRPPLFQHDYPKPDWRIFVESVTELVENSELNGIEQIETGGTKSLLGPSVLGLYGKWGLSGGILFPIYSSVSETQETESYRLNFVLSYWF